MPLTNLPNRFTGLGIWLPEVLCGLFATCRSPNQPDPRMIRFSPNCLKAVMLNRFERVNGFPIWTTNWIRPIGLRSWVESIVRSETSSARLWESHCLEVDLPTPPKTDRDPHFRMGRIRYSVVCVLIGHFWSRRRKWFNFHWGSVPHSSDRRRCHCGGSCLQSESGLRGSRP